MDWRHSDGAEYVEVAGFESADGLFALKVFGRSMEPEYRDGDLLICKWLDPYQPHAIKQSAAVVVHYAPDSNAPGKATFARWHDLGDGRIRLTKDNPIFPPTEWPREAFDQVGVVLSFQRAAP